MYNGFFESIYDSQTTAQKIPRKLSVSNLDAFGATVDSIGSLTMAAFDFYNLEEAKDPWWSDRAPSVKLTVDEANKKYGIAGKLSFDSEIREDAAKLMYDRKNKEISTEQTLSLRTPGQTLKVLRHQFLTPLILPLLLFLLSVKHGYLNLDRLPLM
jgi:hypothetical protein